MQVDRKEEINELPDFSLSCWAKIAEDAKESDECEDNENPSVPEDNIDPKHLSLDLDGLIYDLKMRLEEPDTQLRSGVRKFISRFNKMRESHSTALMASSFHCFGSLQGGTVTSIQGGGIRRGRRIPVQATASGRRKYSTKGKAPAPPERPAKLAGNKENKIPALSRYELPSRRVLKGKRPHHLAFSIKRGTQNAGKW